MTETLSYARAAEIIAAYGGDPARWPDDERAQALAAVLMNPELRTAQLAAAELDADVTAWSQTPVAPGNAIAAATAAMRVPRNYLRWASGTGLAAAIAASLIVLSPVRRTGPVAPVGVAARIVVSDESTAFTQVFTPTPDEEQVL